MLAHQLLQAGDKESRLDRLAINHSSPPSGNRHMVGINELMTERVLTTNQWPNSPFDHNRATMVLVATAAKASAKAL